MREDALLTGTLEPTNEPYAIAKIVGIKLCESYNRQHGVDYRSVMPTNLYGPGDNFHPENGHVMPALMRRFHNAAHHGLDEVTIWGTGAPRREFLHVDDMAEASLFVLDLPKDRYDANTQPMLSHINVGSGSDVTIAELARMLAEVTGFKGRIAFDATKPDGSPRKLMDVSRLADMGWRASIPLEEGIATTYACFLETVEPATAERRPARKRFTARERRVVLALRGGGEAAPDCWVSVRGRRPCPGAQAAFRRRIRS
jgi:nucleoside-diphosphate-sugar epimerase